MNRVRAVKLISSLLLALLVLVLAGLGVERKIRAFQPLGFEVEPGGGGLTVVEVTDPSTRLVLGDQILAVSSGEVPPPDQLAKRLRERPETSLAVVRGADLVEIRYRRPPLDVDFPYLLVALSGAAYLLIGLYTLLRQSGRQGFLFCLWALTSAAAYLLSATPPVDGLYWTIVFTDELALLLLPALTLHLFFVFPGPMHAEGRVRRILPFVYLPAAVLLALRLDQVLFAGRWVFGRVTAASITALDRLELLHLVAFALAAVAVLFYRLAREQEWEQHRQMQWVAIGLAAGYLPFLTFYAIPSAFGVRLPQLLASASVLPLILVPLTFAYAILRYKLWDLEIIVRDTLASALTLLIGVIGFSLVNLALNRGVPRELVVVHNLLSFVAGIGIAGLLVPTRRTLATALERIHYRGAFGRRRALSELGRELLHERNLGRLCTALIEEIETGVEIERANLYLVQGEGMMAMRPEPGLPLRIPGDLLGKGFWQESFLRLSGIALPTEPPSAAQKIFAAGYRYAFPLTVRDRGIGIALAGFKQDHAPLNSEDALLIRHLLNQAALAIENAQLLGQLNLQLQEVQRLQHYSEGIFESSPAGIAVLDANRRLVSVNAAFVALVGRPRRELTGLPLAEVLPVAALPAPGAPVDIEIEAPGGGTRHLQLTIAELEAELEQGEESQDGLRVLLVHDLSERVAMENALKEKERLAALGMLAAGVAHEVNTPITGISSYAQMLLSETPEDDPRHALLKKVERQTFRAASIVNNLLEFARDRQKEKRPVAIAPLLVESLDLLADRREKRRVEVDWQLRTSADEKLLVLGCDGELQQVFTNLFVNAFDAMADKGGRLTVGLEGDERSVRVRVEDTGPGISAEKLESVFQPFFSTKLNRGGTGLGLSISREIVRRHGGDLRVVSRPGEGACFTVELPRYTHPVQVPQEIA